MRLTVSTNDNKSAFYRILLILSIILALLLLNNLIIPMSIDLYDSFMRYSSASQKLETLANWKEKNIQLRKDINKISNSLLQSNISLSSSGQTSKTLAIIDSLAAKNDVKISKMQFDKVIPSGTYKSLKTTVTVQAEYLKILGFLKELENGPVYLDIEKYSMKIPSLYAGTLETQLHMIILIR